MGHQLNIVFYVYLVGVPVTFLVSFILIRFGVINIHSREDAFPYLSVVPMLWPVVALGLFLSGFYSFLLNLAMPQKTKKEGRKRTMLNTSIKIVWLFISISILWHIPMVIKYFFG